MATKPTTLPRFGGVDPATPAANIVAPSSGQMNTGWTLGQKPPSSYFNWLHFHTYRWIAWLDSALVDFGDAVAVRAGELITETLSPSGADPWVEVAGGLLVNADVYHGDQYLNISPLSFLHDGNWQAGSVVSFADAGYIESTGAGRCSIPVPFRAGDRPQSLVFARHGDGAADITSVEVIKFDKDGASTNIAPGTSVANPAATWNDTTVDLTDTTLGASDVIHIRFAANAANIRIGAMRILFDRPAPP